MEKSTRTFLNQQRVFSQSAAPAPERTDPMMVFDQALQEHRRLLSKLDLEEKKCREAREKGRKC